MKRVYTKTNITVYVSNGDRVDMLDTFTVKKPTKVNVRNVLHYLSVKYDDILKIVVNGTEEISVLVDDDLLVRSILNEED